MKIFNTFIHCIPPSTTAQQHKRIFKTKDGRAFLGTDSKGISVQNELCALLSTHAPSPDFPRDQPISVTIRIQYPWRKSEKKSVINRATPIAHTSRPDVDNLLKFLLDCMTRCHYWDDDSQIWNLHAVKVWGPQPGILISIQV